MINLLKEIYRSTVHGEVIAKLGVPSEYEKKMISKLRSKTSAISLLETSDLEGAALHWAEYMNELRYHILNEDPRKFLQWGVIQYSMFIGNNPYIDVELEDLKSSPEFSSKWKNAIEESSLGLPIRYKKYLGSSANLIHHAYHIKKFEETTKKSAKDIQVIFEFGGGYGSMCRLFKNIDFDGQYIIFDLPIFTLLQEYYLESLGYPIITVDEFLKGKKGILCISSIDDVRKVMGTLSESDNNLFIATWSISETPISLREEIFKEMDKINLFLIAYQKTFREVDNIDYFAQLQNKYLKVKWTEWDIPHVPISCYLMGVRNES